MRLSSARIGDNEVAVVIRAGGALPVAEIPGPGGWPADLPSLLEGGRLDELRRRGDGLSEVEVEVL